MEIVLVRAWGHKRQIALFSSAILLPAAVLISLMVRIIVQERELAGKRSVDEQSQAVVQVRRELTPRLEAIRLQQINRLIAGTPWTDPPDDRAVLFIAKATSDGLLLPWNPAAPSLRPESPGFARLRADGERSELIAKDYGQATAWYREALSSADSAREVAEGRLLLARTLAKAGKDEEAFREFDLLLKEGDSRDEQGVAFSLYAAQRLLDTSREPDSVLKSLLGVARQDRWLTPGEAIMLQSMLGSFPQQKTAEARSLVAARAALVAQANELAADMPRVRPQMETSPAQGTVWIAHGRDPWLVSMIPAAAQFPDLAIVVSGSKTAPPGVRLTARNHRGDLGEISAESLGDNFPGVYVEWPAGRFSARNAPVSLYLAGTALVFGFAVVGGYVLLRDVRRDVRMSEVRSQFVANVSHELKTPLTSIRMFAETLAMGRCSDERLKAEYLDTIVNESERLARLVDNVLDFAKIEQGKLVYRFRPTNVREVAEAAARAMQYPLSQQGFSLRLSLEDNLPMLRADPDALQQAILNLLTNAMKYSGEAREIDLRVAVPDGRLVIEVTDRGLGIAPDERNQIFQKFYRADAATPIAGTGLGLTLVAHIAEAHGGLVGVRSTPGKGSTFSLQIPLESRA